MNMLSENVAVLKPRQTLTGSQKDCLATIDFYRMQRRSDGFWFLGPKRFSSKTLNGLRTKELIGTDAKGRWFLTIAGKLALDRLKGE